MINLLRSNLMRLVKSKTFYIVIAVQIFLIIVKTINGYNIAQRNAPVFADYVFTMICSPYAAVMLGIVCSLFIGADYRDGTIRNKLVVGHSRMQTYVANLITTIVSALSICAAGLIVFFAVSFPLLGGFANKASALWAIIMIGLLAMLAYSALFTAVAMISKSTVATLLITIIGVFVVFLLSQYFVAEINTPEEYMNYIINDAGELVEELVKNPNKMSAGVLAFFKVLLNIFPSGQLSVVGTNISVVWLSIVSSVCFLLGSVGVGFAIFRKENLK